MLGEGRKQRIATVATIYVVVLLVVGVGAVATETTSTNSDTAVQTTTVRTTTAQVTPLSIQNLSAPSEVQVGSNYTVTAEIVNQRDSEVVRRVHYQIAGNVIAFQNVLIPANETETIRFDVTAATTRSFPTDTFTHGVFTNGAQATANLSLTAAAQTTTPEETTPVETTPEETTPVETTPEETATPGETTVETTTPETLTANVSFESQTSNGTVVTVESVTVPESGFVVVHDTGIIRGEVVDSMIGESDFLEAGTHRNVTIRLDGPLNESQRLVAILYRDSNENREYDFVSSNRTVDGPYTEPDSREAINDIAFVNVDGGENNETASSYSQRNRN